MNIKNFCKVLVSTGYGDTDTSITLSLNEGTKLPDIADGEYNMVWYNSSDYASPDLDPNKEIVKITGQSGDTITIERPSSTNNYLEEGEENIAKNHNIAGKQYEMIMAVTKGLLTNIPTVRMDTFPAGETTYTVNVSGLTANDLIGDIAPQTDTVGTWRWETFNGYFTITSDKTETSTVNFAYFIIKQ